MSQSNQTHEAPRMDELDGVRGFAALCVVYAHLFLMWVPAPNSALFWVRTSTGMAWTGVILFFVLSGYLIGGNLLRNREAKNYFQVFYTRRALRIFPLYYFLIAVYFVFRFATPFGTTSAFITGPIPLWTYPLLVQNFPMAVTGDWGAGVLSVTWSVALEEQFYLFLPLLIRFVPLRYLPALIAAMAATGPLFRHFLPVEHASFLFPGSIESLFGGAFLAWLHRAHPRFFREPRWLGLALGIFALSGFGMALLTTKHDFGPFGESVITAFWASFLWLVLGKIGTPWTAFFRLSWLREIGRVSYGIYLFHALFYLLLMITITGGEPTHALGGRGALVATAAFVVTLIFALTSFHLVEARLIRIGQRLRYYARAKVPAAPAS